MIDTQIPQQTAAISNRTLRQFACLWIFVLGGWACFLGFFKAYWLPSLLVSVLAVSVGGLGIAKPQSIRAIFSGMIILTAPIGWVVSHLLLACLLYGVFTPLGILFRLLGRDELRLRRCSEKPSYWTAKPTATDLRQYFRQF